MGMGRNSKEAWNLKYLTANPSHPTLAFPLTYSHWSLDFRGQTVIEGLRLEAWVALGSWWALFVQKATEEAIKTTNGTFFSLRGVQGYPRLGSSWLTGPRVRDQPEVGIFLSNMNWLQFLSLEGKLIIFLKAVAFTKPPSKSFILPVFIECPLCTRHCEKE